MKYHVTPYCMTRAILTSDPMAMLARENRHTVHPLSSYEKRQMIEVDAADEHAACECAWSTFQNLDDDHLCPDGGRSLMVGDMVEVVCVDEQRGGHFSWWICCSFGWTETIAPRDEKQEISS